MFAPPPPPTGLTAAKHRPLPFQRPTVPVPGLASSAIRSPPLDSPLLRTALITLALTPYSSPPPSPGLTTVQHSPTHSSCPPCITCMLPPSPPTGLTAAMHTPPYPCPHPLFVSCSHPQSSPLLSTALPSLVLPPLFVSCSITWPHHCSKQPSLSLSCPSCTLLSPSTRLTSAQHSLVLPAEPVVEDGMRLTLNTFRVVRAVPIPQQRHGHGRDMLTIISIHGSLIGSMHVLASHSPHASPSMPALLLLLPVQRLHHSHRPRLLSFFLSFSFSL